MTAKAVSPRPQLRTNPFRDLLELAYRLVCEVDRDVSRLAGRGKPGEDGSYLYIRDDPGEWDRKFQAQWSQLDSACKNAFRAAGKLPCTFETLDQRVGNLQNAIERYILWQRDAPRLTDEERKEILACGFGSDPAGEYLSRAYSDWVGSIRPLENLAEILDEVTGRPAATNKIPQRKKVPSREANVRVANYLKSHAADDPQSIRRAAIVDATGVSAGMVSGCPAWIAFESHRKSKKKPKGRTIQLNDQMIASIPSDTQTPPELAALIAEQEADRNESEITRKHKRGHGRS